MNIELVIIHLEVDRILYKSLESIFKNARSTDIDNVLVFDYFSLQRLGVEMALSNRYVVYLVGSLSLLINRLAFLQMDEWISEGGCSDDSTNQTNFFSFLFLPFQPGPRDFLSLAQFLCCWKTDDFAFLLGFILNSFVPWRKV